MDAIKVLIVDDSAVIRQVLKEVLATDSEVAVIGAVADPVFAMKRMEVEWPDVIILDVEMPRMDGITFLRKLMAERPTPVVMCSTLTERGAETTMQALAAGAVEIITKPKVGVKDFLQEETAHLLKAVRAAARARVGRTASLRDVAPATATPAAAPNFSLRTTEQLVAIGTSTGGTQALEVVLTALPANCPGIVVVQHMPEKFTAAFASRLNGLCQLEVREARDGDRVRPGLALIAPGGRHMLLKRSGAQYLVEVRDGPPVNRHKPSVDVLFRSVARHAGANAVGVIMTGMGDDGASGLLEMSRAGAHTIAQDEASCVVFGMPKEAIKLGGARSVMPLEALAGEIMRFAG